MNFDKIKTSWDKQGNIFFYKLSMQKVFFWLLLSSIIGNLDMSRYCLSWIAEQVFPAYYPNFTFRVSRLKKG